MNTKDLPKLLRSAERTAKRLGLHLEEVSAYSDGTYRVEYKRPEEEPRRIGFIAEDEK